MYYHVSTVQTRVALGIIFEIYIDFYMIVFGLERRAMFKFVKVAALALAFVAGMTTYADAVSLAEVQSQPERYKLLADEKGIYLYLDTKTIKLSVEPKERRMEVTSIIIPHNHGLIGEFRDEVVMESDRSIRNLTLSYKNRSDLTLEDVIRLVEDSKRQNSGMKTRTISDTFYLPNGSIDKKNTAVQKDFVKTPYGAVKYVVASKANEVVYGEVY